MSSILDLALFKIPHNIRLTNICVLFLDYNKVLFEIYNTPITSLPPTTRKYTNSKKFTLNAENHP